MENVNKADLQSLILRSCILWIWPTTDCAAMKDKCWGFVDDLNDCDDEVDEMKKEQIKKV